jgi:hypothetical protein
LFNQVGCNVDASDLRPTARRRDGQVTGAAGYIQHAFVGLDLQAGNKLGRTRLIRFGDLAKVTR